MPNKYESKDAELKALVKQQRIERTNRKWDAANRRWVEPIVRQRQRLGGIRTVSINDHDDRQDAYQDEETRGDSTYDPQVMLFGDDEAENPMIDIVSDTIESLPEDQQALFRMHYAERMSLAEIGEELGVSKQAVHKQIEKLKREVAEMLAAQGITGS